MDLELRQDHSGINMSYNFIRNYIGFDAKRLEEAKNELQSLVPLEVYVKTITMHELGHAIDREALLASLSKTLEFFEMKDQYTLSEIYNDEQLLASLLDEHQMNITFEETAWDNAEKFNQILHLVDENTFNMIRKHSLATYNDLYQEDLQLYNELVMNHTLKPA
ncbi:integrase [Rummeliibacillus sp. JY-2-4R]